MIDDLNETALPLAVRNRNEFLVCRDDDLGLVRADALRLKQCLLNLLSNACKFTENGRVTFRVARSSAGGADWLEFSVEDTGIGLSDEEAGRLFQPFTQADASTTRRFGGTGLGLAITKKLCEAMGGTISLRSRLGEGSTFTVRLPRCEPA
jgi:adenylate cyclase